MDPGGLWRELVLAAYDQEGLIPPVLTYVGLSIGGTLSMGGLSWTNAEGSQVDG